MTQTFVPNDFEVPESFVNEYFRLEVLEPSVAEMTGRLRVSLIRVER